MAHVICLTRRRDLGHHGFWRDPTSDIAICVYEAIHFGFPHWDSPCYAVNLHWTVTAR